MYYSSFGLDYMFSLTLLNFDRRITLFACVLRKKKERKEEDWEITDEKKSCHIACHIKISLSHFLNSSFLSLLFLMHCFLSLFLFFSDFLVAV